MAAHGWVLLAILVSWSCTVAAHDPLSVFGRFEGYLTPAEVASFASAVVQRLPAASSLHLLGNTLQNRPIHAVLLGNCTKDHHAVTYVAMHHAREVRPGRALRGARRGAEPTIQLEMGSQHSSHPRAPRSRPA